ncbi:MAG TPA: uroporphyrinogen decarboxylase family protein [Armatimonadota bacterium]|jgi:uroporphyrinogen-III decarboxylase
MASDLTSREIIKRVIHFQDPPRVGLYFSRFGVDDTVDVFDFHIRDAHNVDPWGVQWVTHPDVPSLGQVKEHLVKTMADVAKLTPPDPVYYVQQVREALARLTPEQRDKYRFIATSSGIWEVSRYLRGMAELMEDMVLDPALVDAVVAFSADYWVAFLEELAPLADEIDAIWMFDDWGTQSDVMISPTMWRRYFGPHYRRIVAAAHALGMDFWLHSCGRVTNLIGDFIDVGMDLVNPYQSKTCGYEEVAEKFAGKIAFLATVDTQATLTRGTVAQVKSEIPRVAKWGTEHGGLIVSNYNYDTPEENEQAVLDYFLAKG